MVIRSSLVLCVALLVFAGCGSSKPPAEPVAEKKEPVAKKEAPATPVAEAAPAEAEKVTEAPKDEPEAAKEPEPPKPRKPVKPTELTPPEDAEKSRSGLASKVLKPGTGDKHPKGDDTVVVHYSVWDRAGMLLDSSLKRGEPRSFRVDKQLAGWEEGLELMVEGEHRRLWIPEKLAYKGRSGKPKGTLIWDAELIAIKSPPPPPKDLKKPPKDAQRTKSGLAYKMLKPATDKIRPKEGAVVQVQYTGWTTDGVCFDTTRIEDEPTMFNVNDVIEGWTEGLQLMQKGQEMRFWIPKKLAYKGKRGRPAGMLVFDVELLEVVNP